MSGAKPPDAASEMQPTTCTEAEPFALRVTDDSMAPEFREGCVILVDPTGRATDGAFVLAEVDERYVFRRLRETAAGVALEPINPAYPRIQLSRGMAAVKGVIVQRAGTRRREHKRYD